MPKTKNAPDSPNTDNIVGGTVKGVQRVCCAPSGHLTAKALDLDVDEARQLMEARGLNYYEGANKRIIRWLASSEVVDRHGDITRQNWELENYKRNPVMLWMHNMDIPPVGRSLREQVMTLPGEKGNDEKLFVIDAVGVKPGISLFSDTVWDMAIEKFITASSVSFVSLEHKVRRDEEGYFVGWEHMKNELWELSPVTLPANPETMQLAADHRVTRGMANILFGKELANEEWGEIASHITARKTVIQIITRTPTDLERVLTEKGAELGDIVHSKLKGVEVDDELGQLIQILDEYDDTDYAKSKSVLNAIGEAQKAIETLSAVVEKAKTQIDSAGANTGAKSTEQTEDEELARVISEFATGIDDKENLSLGLYEDGEEELREVLSSLHD